MTNLEHYFENLLFLGRDISGDLNKNSLSKKEQNAVEVCYSYILYNIFNGDKEELQKWLKRDKDGILW